jgi:hypothetical protein
MPLFVPCFWCALSFLPPISATSSPPLVRPFVHTVRLIMEAVNVPGYARLEAPAAPLGERLGLPLPPLPDGLPDLLGERPVGRDRRDDQRPPVASPAFIWRGGSTLTLVAPLSSVDRVDEQGH